MFRITVLATTIAASALASVLTVQIGRAASPVTATDSIPTAVVLTSSPSADPDPERDATSPASILAVEASSPIDGHDGADRELIEWAIGRFAEVGIALPDVEIIIDSTHDRCEGAAGRFIGSDEQSLIILCLDHRESYGAVLHRRRTLIHELAHAWDYHHLAEADRAQLLPVLDVETWYDTEPDWEDRGAERFAETLAWGLYDQLRRPVLIDVSCEELHRDFEAITGRRALGPVEGVCELHEAGPEWPFRGR